jgi:5-methylcytosine-specific restriction endonuclease McrA
MDSKEAHLAKKKKWKGNSRFLARLLVKHNGACAICSAACLVGAPERHPLQPTIDHIVPLWRGGARGYENCQLACYACNQKKSRSESGERLRRNAAKNASGRYRLYPNGIRLDVKP